VATAALALLAATGLMAQQEQQSQDPQVPAQTEQPRQDQLPAQQPGQQDQFKESDNAPQGRMEAQITDVDPEKGTVTVRMKDKDGKDVEKTFQLTGKIRYLDSAGNIAAVNISRAGNDVLLIEREGNLQEMRQKTETQEREPNQLPPAREQPEE